MISLHEILMLLIGISAVIIGVKKIKWVNDLSFMLILFISLLAEILTQVFIVYKFPLLFISWILITDPLVLRIIDYYNKLCKEK